MQTLEQKKIVIKLPALTLKSFLSIRFFLILSLILFSSAFSYWYHSVRPYLWISSAHLNAFSTTVSSDGAGRIAEMGPQEGDRVKKGQMLFSLDRDLILAKYSQVKSEFDSLNRQVEFEKEQIGKAMESYLAATTELELGIGTPENVQKQLNLMEEAQNKSESAFAKVGALKAELSLLELELRKTTVAAPFEGIVLKRFNNEGAVVSFGDAVYTLCDPDRLWVETEVSEKEVGLIAIGTPAHIRVSAYPKKNLVGKVTYVGAATAEKSDQRPFSQEQATIPIKISVENPDSSLKPGLSARVNLKVR